MMLKVAVFNFKGGTGKSTTALNLGAALATRNRQVLLIDLDGQRTLSFGLGLDGHEPTTLDWLMKPQTIAPYPTVVDHLSLIPGDLGMFRLSADADLFTPALAELKPFDLVLMDCPPGLGLASVQAILSCDRILIPTLCEPASLKGLAEAVSLIREDRTKIPIDVLRSRYKPRLRLTQDADELLKDAAAELNYQLLQTVIPENIAIAEAIAQQQSVLNYAPKSSGTQAFKTLAKECSKLWKTP
jgi:chromosome partitioning protein